MLEIAGLSVAYGKHRAVDDVALSVGRSEVVVILGANGSGKSSLLKAVCGIQPAAPGARVQLGGRDIANLPAHAIVESGLALVPEGRGIFGDLTVRENLLLGAFARRARANETANLDQVLALFPRLAERLGQTARTMSGGEQQMVAIGRALMSAPDILLLDEPSLGLSPLMCGELFAALGHIRTTGIGVLLVEQNAKRSLAIADRGYLIENGRIVGAGSASALQNDPAVQRAYLGGATVNTTSHDTGDKAMFNIDLLISGAATPAAGGRTFERQNPLNGQVATRAAAAGIGDANAAADAAARAFPGWSALGPNERRGFLLKAADALAARTGDFIARMAAETGSTAGWAGFNVHLAAGMLREAAAMTTQIGGEVIPSDKPGCIAMALRQPVGVVVGIAPWNAPVILGVRALAMPLACGNTVVLKASETCPATHALIAECLAEAGLPPGVVNVVTNAPADAAAVVEALIAHPAVRRINFTGSTKVGRVIAEKAARYLKPVLLELGGKAPMLVLDDADLDEAVKAGAFGAFMNQGQICMSTERIVVDQAVADAFVAKFAAKAATLVAGDPGAGNTPLGAAVSREAIARVQNLVADATAQGAVVVAGGKADGALMDATVVDRVTPEMKIYHEETFGPVVCVVRAKDTDDAVRIANDTEYGLSAAVFGRDIVRALNVAKRIDSGICHVNGPTVHDEAQMPFGGTKASGYGRFGGKAGVEEFTELRWITIETQPGRFPI